MHPKRHPLKLTALGLLLLPLLAGCGGGGGGGNGNTGGGTTSTGGTNSGGTNSGGTNSGNNNGTQPVTTASATLPDGLTATLAENSATAPNGGSVTYTLTLANNTGAAVVIQAPSTTLPPVYLTLTDASGNVVYNPMPAPPLTTVSLSPGQSLSQTVTLATTTGVYAARATFSQSDGTTPTPVGPLILTVQ